MYRYFFFHSSYIENLLNHIIMVTDKKCVVFVCMDIDRWLVIY